MIYLTLFSWGFSASYLINKYRFVESNDLISYKLKMLLIVSLFAPLILANELHSLIIESKWYSNSRFRFFCCFLFCKGYKGFYNLDQKTLHIVNETIIKNRSTNSVGHRIDRFGLRLLNKRNKFTYNDKNR